MNLTSPIATVFVLGFSAIGTSDEINFNLDVRPILSNKCFLCHGPDLDGVQAGLRLDGREFAISELDSGEFAVVPGRPEESALIARIISNDEDLRMPPADHGTRLTAEEIRVFRTWISEGAKYAKHWAYVKPVRPDLPIPPKDYALWPENGVDNFLLSEMLSRGMAPSARADRYALVRRVFLDLTGLPPTIEEADQFANSEDADAYGKLVDDLLTRPSFGEHWARKWLDLARYADSAGYADDPPRTIWAYRDWVVKAINDNMPFDQFTTEQIAGDLLPEPSEDQLIATAFHRNTLTNNEGGTQDEEFRNVAVVDRVNTTMAVWMGTTMACAQCHTHKYDPITQEEYFRFFAVFNNTQDADRRNESPLVEIYTDEQLKSRDDLTQRISTLQTLVNSPTPALAESQKSWEQTLQQKTVWTDLPATAARRSSGQEISVLDDGRLLVQTESLESLPTKDNYVLNFDLQPSASIAAIQLAALPHDSLPNKGSGHSGGNFVITGLKAQIVPQKRSAPQGRFIRVTQRGRKQILSLAEVQVFSGGQNVAKSGRVTQQSTAFNGPARLAIDGNTEGDYQKGSVTHSEITDSPWLEVDLGSSKPVEKIVLWNRTDNGLHTRLSNFSIELLDADREVIWQTASKTAPNPSSSFSPSNVRDVEFATAIADYHQPGFEPAEALAGKNGDSDGWAIGGAQSKPHQLVLVPKTPIATTEAASLRITIQHQSTHARHLLGHFGFRVTEDKTAIMRASIPADILGILDKPADKRNQHESRKLAAWYRSNAASDLADTRSQLAKAAKRLAEMKPATSVPVLRELVSNRRETFLQFRGSYLDKGPKVEVGVPAVFHPVENPETLNRLGVAKWLCSEQNPLTARVVANRYWETIFGRGIVATSEEFGSQGELPTHPALLDWLATELVSTGWDTKSFVRTLVTSAAYQQSARVDAEKTAMDPDNRWLARGPRIRLSAEMVRDQALFAAGLLSPKMYGPPVKPPQPDMGLKAAFGGSTDWKTSGGEDRYRRGLYTTWRRSNPYPSMATFDAPNREVCTVRRNRTNTPLQSLVTLNDPVYVEAAQSLGRLALQHEGPVSKQLSHAFRRCLLRPPTERETQALAELFHDSKTRFADSTEDAMKLATLPLGKLPDGIDAVDAAAMTVVCNVLLNLDEMFLKR